MVNDGIKREGEHAAQEDDVNNVHGLRSATHLQRNITIPS